MFSKGVKVFWMGWLMLALLAGCGGMGPAVRPTPQVSAPAGEQAAQPAPTVTRTIEPALEELTITWFYPTAETPVVRGQEIRFTLQVHAPDGTARVNALTELRVFDADGALLAELPAEAGRGAVYRSAPWVIPGEGAVGAWRVEASAASDSGLGAAASLFEVQPSRSDELLEKYGFWIDPPRLNGIQPNLAAEAGDGQNGEIIWGGVKPAMHMFPENWIELHWRAGEYDLADEAAVRRFLLEALGEIGFTPLRALGPFERFVFKDWPGWKVGARGETRAHQIEWVVFYAPEVDKTYALSTMVVLPPAVGDPHAYLRQSFRVDPAAPAQGVAPKPLAQLLPGPELLEPPLGARFSGAGEQPVLSWAPVKRLAEDEFYEVWVDYYVRENQPRLRFTTRETSLALPAALYKTPSCRFYNWQVQLKRQTGVDDNGDPLGEPLSYKSLYRYLWWLPAPEDDLPVVTCAYSHIE